MRPVIVAQTNIMEEADQLERLYITKYNALFPHGYNLTLGGRGTLFDLEAKVESFKEATVSDDEIVAEANARLASPKSCCRVCGNETFWESCSECGVGHEFGNCVLSHLVLHGSAADFALPDSPAVVMSLRKSADADFMLNVEKSRLEVRRNSEALPSVASRYTERLIPFIRQSLKRSVLVKKGQPSFTLGRFRAFTGKKSDAAIVMKVECYLHKHRKELATTFCAHVEVFNRALIYYGIPSGRQKIVTDVLSERGATAKELQEAVADAELLAKLKSEDAREREKIYPEAKEDLVRKNEDQISFTISLAISPEIEKNLLLNLFAGNLDHFLEHEGTPAILVFHQALGPESSIRRFRFANHADRRAYVRRLLEFAPDKRLGEVKTATSSSQAGFIVESLILPKRTTVKEP